jgi:hypothetical protein
MGMGDTGQMIGRIIHSTDAFIFLQDDTSCMAIALIKLGQVNLFCFRTHGVSKPDSFEDGQNLIF